MRDCARSGADEVLEHYPEVGDREVQSALDALVDQAADLLRELDAAATDLEGRVRVAARQAGPFALDDRGHRLHDEVPR